MTTPDTDKPSRFPVITIESDDNVAQILQKFYDYGLTMKERCIKPPESELDRAVCRYRSPDKQNACLIGAALTDEEAYEWEGNGGSEPAIALGWPAFTDPDWPDLGPTHELYDDIQDIHDDGSLFVPSLRDDRFGALAAGYDVAFLDGKFTMKTEPEEADHDQESTPDGERSDAGDPGPQG